MIITKRKLMQSMIAAPALASPALLIAATDNAVSQTSMAMKSKENPGFYRYRVGDIEITALLDGYNALPTQFILGYDESAARESTKTSYRRFTTGTIPIPVNGYVINTGSEMILLDAGAPSVVSQSLGGLAANMQAAGINPGDIDTVLLTHMHVDHIGALVNKDGAKLFENATLMCSEIEWGFVHSDEVRMAMPEAFRGMIDLARFAVTPYTDQRQMFAGEKELFTGITSIPLPGHTPGHTGFAIHSNNESLLIWGDVVHFTTLQFSNPDWGVVFDADPEQAKKTRLAMLDRASADQMAVAGMHIDFPGIGYVERSNDTYRYVSAPWMPM